MDRSCVHRSLLAVSFAAFATIAALAAEPAGDAATSRISNSWQEIAMQNHQKAEHPYIGMWVTEDGHVRHELLPNGRYDEARGSRQSAYQGLYWLEGDHIEYVDDTGFTADGDFRDGVLYHGGMIFYRQEKR